MAEAKDSSENNVLHQQNLALEINLLGEDTSPELLLAHHYRQHAADDAPHHYNHRRRNHRRHDNSKNRYQRSRYNGQYYRHGRWQLVRDRHGRLMYDWRRY